MTEQAKKLLTRDDIVKIPPGYRGKLEDFDPAKVEKGRQKQRKSTKQVQPYEEVPCLGVSADVLMPIAGQPTNRVRRVYVRCNKDIPQRDLCVATTVRVVLERKN